VSSFLEQRRWRSLGTQDGLPPGPQTAWLRPSGSRLPLEFMPLRPSCARARRVLRCSAGRGRRWGRLDCMLARVVVLDAHPRPSHGANSPVDPAGRNSEAAATALEAPLESCGGVGARGAGHCETRHRFKEWEPGAGSCPRTHSGASSGTHDRNPLPPHNQSEADVPGRHCSASWRKLDGGHCLSQGMAASAPRCS